jgi:hypothetical protein
MARQYIMAGDRGRAKTTYLMVRKQKKKKKKDGIPQILFKHTPQMA